MGYGPDDVQEALAKDEPSAIKDAYLIVRETHLMKANPMRSIQKAHTNSSIDQCRYNIANLIYKKFSWIIIVL